MQWQPEGTYWTQFPEVTQERTLVRIELFDEWLICELGMRVFNEWADIVYCYGGALMDELYIEEFSHQLD